jgi:hypothetical protein
MPSRFLLPFGRRRSLLGPSCSRWGVAPSSRSADRAAVSTRTPTGLPRSTRVRYDRGGCSLYPEAAVSIPMAATSTIGACRFSTASHAPRCNDPSAGLGITRHHREFTHVHPSGLPRTCGFRMERKPLGHNT